MTSLLRKIFLAFVTVTACWTSLQAQEAIDETVRQVLPVSYEAIPFYSTDTTAALVRFHYRINQRFFIFIRNTTGASNFVAKGELMVELRDKQNIATGREIRQIVLLRDTQPREDEQLPDIQGTITFQVPEDEYTLFVNIDDKESGRKFIDRNKRIVTRNPQQEILELSNPMFAQLTHSGNGESQTLITAANRGTNALFGVTSGLVYQIFLPDNMTTKIRWRIQREGRFLTDWFQTFNGDQYTLLRGGLSPSAPQEKAVYNVTQIENVNWKILYIPLPIEKLDPGPWSIDLEISAGEKQITKHYAFQVLWLNRPNALLNSQLSIEALQHIASEDEISNMQTGSLELNVKAFYEFWKKRDPDTTTAYNERMVEYYRRVDEANKKFSTLGSPDGFQTDQGRIFILYGEPTHTEKFIPPGEPPSEIWNYARFKKRFIFTDKFKNGNFVLIAAENL